MTADDLFQAYLTSFEGEIAILKRQWKILTLQDKTNVVRHMIVNWHMCKNDEYYHLWTTNFRLMLNDVKERIQGSELFLIHIKAGRYRDYEIAYVLLELGASYQHFDKSCWTPLMRLCYLFDANSDKNHGGWRTKCIQFLLDKGVDPNRAFPHGGDGFPLVAVLNAQSTIGSGHYIPLIRMLLAKKAQFPKEMKPIPINASVTELLQQAAAVQVFLSLRQFPRLAAKAKYLLAVPREVWGVLGQFLLLK